MFQIVSALVLDVPEAAASLNKFQRASPDVLLTCKKWGHLDHAAAQCHCLSSDRTAAYIHTLSNVTSPRKGVFSPLLLPSVMDSGVCGGQTPGDSSALVSPEILPIRPGSVPLVSHRAGAYGQLLVATYERMMTGALSACDWLRPLHGVLGEWLLQSMWGLADVS